MTKTTLSNSPLCVIVGAGPGNGESIARQFSQAGYNIALIARNTERIIALADQIDSAKAYPCDVTDNLEVESTFKVIIADYGRIDALIYNAGKGVWGDALLIERSDFENAWRLNACGAFDVVRQVLPIMQANSSGNIIFLGATASRRGSANSVAYAAAKAAQRSLAESLAKAYGPKGIHVSYVIIDAVVGGPLMKAKLTDRPDDFFCEPNDIAKTVFMLIQQSRTAWTFELDIRPFKENW